MKQKLFTLLTLLLFVCGGAWAQTLIYSNGFENGTDSWGKSSMSSGPDAETTNVRTGAKSIKYVSSSSKGYTTKSITFTKDKYIHGIVWAKASASKSVYLSLNSDNGSATDIGSSGWTKVTHSYSYTGSTGSKNVRLYMNDTKNDIKIYIDDAVFYYSTSSTIDLTAPTAPTPVSATTSSISWTNGSDSGTGATGIQNTLIFKRTSGSADDLTLNDQGIYSLTSTEGPNTDQSGHWTLVNASVAAAATSYEGTFSVGDRYAIVHRDLAYNYSTPTYVTVTTGITADITFANADGATGVVPAKLEGVSGVITLPTNHSMWYADGYTMTGWDEDGDGTADYEPGEAYTVSGDATLTAVFESNGGTTLADRTGATTIKWGPFTQNLGVPVININGTTGFVVAQADVNGTTIDVKLPIDATASGAKFVNQPTNNWTQVNPGIVFTIPAADGATVSYKQYDNGATTTPEVTATGSTYALTLTGTSGQLYIEYIQVVLPGPTYDVNFTLSNVTKTSGATTVEGGTEYTATFAAAEDYLLPASVTVTAGGSDITANCTWAKATGTLTIPAAYVTGNIAITIEGEAVAGTTIIKAVLQSSSSATITGTVSGSYTADSQVQPRDNGKGGCKLGKDGAWVCITLTSGWKFKAGDIVKVNIGTAGSGGTFAFYKESEGTNAILTTDEGPTAGLHTFVLPAAANNEASLYLVRKADSNFNPYVDYIEVIRPVSVTVGANGYTTFASPAILDLTDANRPAGLKAYKATRDGASLTFTALNQTVPAGTGLLLLGETKGGTYYISSAASGTTVESNALVGVTTPTAKQSVEDDTYYFVMKKAADAESPLQFLPLSTSSEVTIPAGKAYIEVPNGDLTSSHELTFTFEDATEGDVTGIAEVNAKKAFTGEFYNLNGQKVSQPTKGLYIVNGKKVVIR